MQSRTFLQFLGPICELRELISKWLLTIVVTLDILSLDNNIGWLDEFPFVSGRSAISVSRFSHDLVDAIGGHVGRSVEFTEFVELAIAYNHYNVDVAEKGYFGALFLQSFEASVLVEAQAGW